MPILLNNDEVDALVSPRECVQAMAAAYLELGRQEAAYRPRSDLYVRTSHENAFYRLRTMEGASAGLGVAAIRMGSDVVRWRQVGDHTEQQHVKAAAGERYVGIVMVFDVVTSEPLLIFPDGALQRLRVGITTALAAQVLARPDSQVAAVLGSGHQAQGVLRSLAAVFPALRFRVYSPRPERRQAFAAALAADTGAKVEPAESAAAAVRGADVIACASNSLDPVLRGEWLEPGMHIGAIEWCELDEEVFRRSQQVMVHVQTGVDNYLAGVTAENVTGLHKHDMEGWRTQLPTISAVMAGQAPGRSSPQDITCFVNNVGCGLQFAALGKMLFEAARTRGVGRQLPLDWFTQDLPS